MLGNGKEIPLHQRGIVECCGQREFESLPIVTFIGFDRLKPDVPIYGPPGVKYRCIVCGAWVSKIDGRIGTKKAEPPSGIVT